METLMYILEVISQAWPIILLMGIIAIPILWMWLEENNQYEPLDDYYVTFTKEQIEKYNTK
jgi:hypothetical protein